MSYIMRLSPSLLQSYPYCLLPTAYCLLPSNNKGVSDLLENANPCLAILTPKFQRDGQVDLFFLLLGGGSNFL